MENRYDRFTSLILNIGRSIQKIKSFEMAEFGLRGNQVQCLFHLSQSGEGKSLKELCALCFEDKGALSRELNDLIEKGFVIKKEGDLKYKNPYVLTEKGKRESEKMNALIEEMVEKGGSGIREEEREGFYKNLAIVDNNLQVICRLYGGKNG